MRRREQKRRKTKMSIISKNNKNKKKANDFGYINTSYILQTKLLISLL